MAQTPKEHKSINIKMDKMLAEALNDFCKETGISKTATIEKAVKKYIEYYLQTGKLLK